MKKMFFLAATAALALSSCTSDEIVQEQPVAEDGAVVFSAYAGRANRATTINEASALAKAGGFGVYAYDQGDVAWATYNASNTQPNFFYNQQVYEDGAGKDGTGTVTTPSLKWVYEPVKYYNNNVDAKHSFFAYAPYKHDVKAVFSLGKAPQIRYTMGVDDYDLMWGAHYDDAKATLSNVDVAKPGIENTISFDFKHALTCVSIEAIPFVDKVHSGEGHGTHNTYGTLAHGTVVTLRSVKFIGAGSTTSLASQGLLNLADGKWTVEGTDEGAYEMATATEWDASGSDLIITEDPHLKKIATNKMLIPASADGSEVKVQVVYDVKTVDPTDPKNNSTITNTITSEYTYTLVGGTAYMFHLDLGLTSVKFTAKVTPWNTGQKEVDLPNNVYAEVVAASSSTSVTVAAGEVNAGSFASSNVGDIILNNGKTKAFVCLTPTTTEPAADATFKAIESEIIFNSSNNKVYVWGTTSYADPVTATVVTSLELNAESKLPTSSVPVAPVNGNYYVCNGTLYKWYMTPPPATPSNRR